MAYSMNRNAKIFFSKLLVLTVVIIVLDVTIGAGIRYLFYKQRSGKYFTTSHALKNSNEEIVIFGNSHAAQHFDAPLMKKELAKTVFNFGNQGQSLFYVYTLVKSILTYNKPGLIILNLDNNELQYDLNAYQRLSVFLPYYHINPVVDSAISMTGDNEKWKAWSSLYRYNSTLGYLLLNTYGHAFNKSMESLGYDPVIGNICSAVPGNDGGGEQAVSRKKIIDPLKVEYLIKLINVIQANHIKLLVTTTPLVSDDTENGLYKEKMKEILTKFYFYI